MNELNQNLSSGELDELEAFLSQPEIEDRSMDLSMLEGYLTAILIGPSVVPPSKWLPWVWDADEGREEAVFDGVDEANRIMSLLMRMYNGIGQVFMAEPSAFEPMYHRGAQWGAAEWCEGFLLGTQFESEAWSAMWLTNPTWWTPFLRLGTDDGVAITLKERDAERWMSAVAPSLVSIHGFWQERRNERQPGTVEDDFGFGRQRVAAVRSDPKIGRNEPCPCRSGKKFKKCCGAAERAGVLH
ncbi:MAG: hypothetical protein B7X31_12325 [Thiomonas sp. 13-66-29]|jgi:uncharacterized protein|nr:MAG: hypothetical protein B7X31_12325 [Thiomonas sp. 13-66-29]